MIWEDIHQPELLTYFRTRPQSVLTIDPCTVINQGVAKLLSVHSLEDVQRLTAANGVTTPFFSTVG